MVCGRERRGRSGGGGGGGGGGSHNGFPALHLNETKLADTNGTGANDAAHWPYSSSCLESKELHQ